ncbi:MAG: IS256 family transposase [Lysobacter sp.]
MSKTTGTGRLHIIRRKQGAQAVREALAAHGQALLPMLELIEHAQVTIDELMGEAARALIEQLLQLSAQEVAGVKHQGRAGGAIGWHGMQHGRIALAERKLRIRRPRLRRKEGGGEVEIPAYRRLHDDGGLGGRVRDIVIAGVSTRKYRRVLPQVADSVGIAKSSVSRRFIEASAAQLAALQKRRFDSVDLLAIYIDGIFVAGRHVVVAIGVDGSGAKLLLGLADGATENARVVKDLLSDLIARVVDASREYLFVIDGAKALAAAIEELFGDRAHVQRCRTHKVRNVVERLPKELAGQVKSVMHAAYQLAPKDGMAKLRQQAKWLQTEHPDAASSLLEGLEQTFTVNRMNLSPQLIRCLSTTNLVENPNGIVRATTRRVKNYRDAEMIKRWVAAGFLEAEKSFRKIQGVKDLWMLKAALHRPLDARRVDDARKAA